MSTTDPSTFSSSAEIFSANHTLPQIRAIHKDIHVQIEDKASRLRTQVGNSYRDLLGTADTIVCMRSDNDDVQTLLGGMGGRCGRAVIGAKAIGLARFVEGERDGGAAAAAARLRLLDACLLIIGRVLKGAGEGTKKGDRLILATKVLVLSRLLIKNLEEDKSGTVSRKALDMAKTTRRNLQRRLSKNVEKVLEAAAEDEDRENVLKALCAYSLVTSCGAKDALRHFLHVRASAMGLAFELDEGERERSTEDVVRGLTLFSRTLLDVQVLVPSRLSQALSSLKSHPLLDDTSLKQLEGLRLDLYERWCGEEIRYYTPFIRHDDLDGKAAKDMLTDWLKKGTEVLLEGLKKTLVHLSEFKAIMELRTRVLQLWIRNGGRARGIDPSDMQDELREAINSRMLELIDTKVRKLHLVGQGVSNTLDTWKDGITDEHQSFWDDEGYETALASGAAPFVQEVVSRFYGRNDAVSKAVNSYKTWFHVIDDVKGVVETLKKQRWDNDIDEIEDEETIEERQQLLSKEDPQMLQKKLDTTLDKTFKDLREQIQKLWDGQADGSRKGAVAIYLVRVLRDIRSQLPERPAVKDFGLDMVAPLHNTVVTFVSKEPLEGFSSRGLSQRNVVGKTLWEGDPLLPSQPSPEVFQFLRNLSHSMSESGIDLWTPTAVSLLKQHLSKQLCETWLEAIAAVLSDVAEEASEPFDDEKKGEDKKDDDGKSEDEKEKGVEPGAKAEDEKETKSRLSSEQAQELFTQWLFDIAYLRCYIGSPAEGTRDEFKSLEEMVYQRTKLESGPARQRIIKASKDYWQRTNLLFGLLM